MKKIKIRKKINGKTYIFYAKQTPKSKSFECHLFKGKNRKDRGCACSIKRTYAEALEFGEKAFLFAETGEF